MKTALLMGGVSEEREVSLMSGRQVLESLKRLGVEPLVVDPHSDKAWMTTLVSESVRRVFNILHGGAGENGEIRGALNCLGIACTGSEVAGSAIAMDKRLSKAIWQGQGIPTPPWRCLGDGEDVTDLVAAMPPPWFVKPACGGSSTHSAAVSEAAELPAAIARAATETGSALVEQYIVGDEYTLSILGDRALPLIGIRPQSGFYDYEAKYIADDTQFLCPCDLPAERESELAALGHRAFLALGCSGWGRVDFILDGDGRPFLLEANTVPGMTGHSLVPTAAAAVGIDFDNLVGQILETAGQPGGSDG